MAVVGEPIGVKGMRISSPGSIDLAPCLVTAEKSNKPGSAETNEGLMLVMAVRFFDVFLMITLAS